MKCGSSGVDTYGMAHAQIIGDGGFETFDERPQAEAAGREQGVDVGARCVSDLPPLQGKVGERNRLDIRLE